MNRENAPGLRGLRQRGKFQWPDSGKVQEKILERSEDDCQGPPEGYSVV